MEYKFLTPDHIPQVHQTFHEAFADYAVDVSYMTEDVIRNRAIKNGIDFSLSVGAFDGEKMVGFTLVGIDAWQDEKSAFDIMTGITLPWRGKGVAGGMFDFCLPKISEAGVKYFVLEVLQENEAAINAYSKNGFEIVRSFNCYQADPHGLNIKKEVLLIPEISRIDKSQLIDGSDFLDWQPSWENSISSLQRIPDELLISGAYKNGELIGMLAYYPLIQWVNLLTIHKSFRHKGVATELLRNFVRSLEASVNEIKVINVDSKDEAMNSFLLKSGFNQLTSQYEMRSRL